MNTFTEVAKMLVFFFLFFFFFCRTNTAVPLLLSLDFHTRASKAAGVPDRLHVNTMYVRGQRRRSAAVWTEGQITTQRLQSKHTDTEAEMS